MSWRWDAACRSAGTSGLPPEAWFPPGQIDSKQRAKAAAPALFVCREQCPVQRQCADEGTKLPNPCGIWGGVDMGDLSLSSQRFADERKKRQTDLEWVAIGGAI